MDYGMDYQGGGGGFSGGGGGFDGSNVGYEKSSYGGGGGGGYGTAPSVGRTPPSSSGRTNGGGDGGSARREADEQTIRSVTISMCLASQPDPDGTGAQLADGRKVHHVKIVGAVRGLQEFSTNTNYEIEDGTGLIDVKQWTNAEADVTALVQLRQLCLAEHLYLVIVGQIKDYDGKKTLLADWIRPLTTGNELTCHMLDVVHSAETFKRQHTFGHQPSMTNARDMGFAGVAVQPFGGGGNSTDNDGKQEVLAWIRENGRFNDEGVHVDACIQAFSRRFSVDDVRSYMELLTTEGHIYTSIDDAHFKCAT